MPAPPPPAASFVDATNSFALDLWAKLRERPGNLAVSPASIWVALAMASEGARGETATEMTAAMRMPADADATRADAGRRLAAWNATRGTLTLRVANRLFAEKRFRFERAFVQATRTRWRAPIEALDFRAQAEAARVRINRWVESETASRIPELLPPASVTADTALLLTNAIYFLGRWTNPFQHAATRDQSFFLGPGEGVQAPTMFQSALLRYAEADGVQILELPYRGGDFAMTFVLPREIDGLAALEARLDVPALARWVAALDDRHVIVYLPKFTIDPPEALQLSNELEVLGMRRAFERGLADFTGIANPPRPEDRLSISAVFHEAFVKVDEDGTEAAAATAVMMVRAAGAAATPPPEFRADHPFLFFLRDTASGVILFAGRVADPRRS
jgi:serpin B